MFERYATGQYPVREITQLARTEDLAFRKTRNSVPQSSVHKMLRNRIHMGDFVWNEKVYQGAMSPS